MGPFPALWAPSLCPCSLLGPPSAETCNILQHPATVHPKSSEILSLVQLLHGTCMWSRGHGASLHYLHCTSLCGNPPQLEAPSARRRHLLQAPSPREQTPKTALTAEGLSFSGAWEASKISELAGKRGLQCVSQAVEGRSRGNGYTNGHTRSLEAPRPALLLPAKLPELPVPPWAPPPARSPSHEHVSKQCTGIQCQ